MDSEKAFGKWWSLPLREAVASAHADPDRGLSNTRVANNRAAFGVNAIAEIKPTGIGELILEGVKEPMMVVLLSIGGLSLLFGKPAEAAVMIFVVAAETFGLRSSGPFIPPASPLPRLLIPVPMVKTHELQSS